MPAPKNISFVDIELGEAFMKTTVAGGRAWHFSHSIGRLTAEHNESKYGITGGSCYPMDVAVSSEGILFILSRGFGY